MFLRCFSPCFIPMYSTTINKSVIAIGSIIQRKTVKCCTYEAECEFLQTFTQHIITLFEKATFTSQVLMLTK